MAEYYWHQGEFKIIESAGRAMGSDSPPEPAWIKLTFSEFRDLVQCQARGGFIGSGGGRPRVLGWQTGFVKKR